MSDFSPPISSEPHASPSPLRALILFALTFAVGALLVTVFFLLMRHDDTAVELHVKPSNTLLLATRDLARLETSEMHVEKVIDLTDKQSNFFDLIDGSDNVLLVAVGDITLGVDLAKIKDGDVSIDETTHAAHFALPAVEVFSTRLDEKGTYVYSRSTTIFAKRNEQLETHARQEAQKTLQQQADTPEARERAKKQAEKVLRELATSLGATSVTFDWR